MYFAKISLVTEAIVLSMGISSGRSGQAERGKYLLEEVGNCQECYSSDIADSQFQPKQPVKAWYEKAPGLTPGSRLWQRWGENGLITFLETGLGPTGHGADPPIPTYKLKHEDAQAIVDYLKSPK